MSVRVRVMTIASAAGVVLLALASAHAAQSDSRGGAASPPWAEAAQAGGGARAVDLGHARATFQTLCSKCHDLGLVTSQRHDRAGWSGVVERMRGLNFVASDEEANEVIEYLAANYPARQ